MSDLTGSTALDVAIALSFVYVLFSVLCAAVQEAIAGIFDLRASSLEKGLHRLLDDNGVRAASAATLTKRFLAHGLIRTQYQQSLLIPNRRRGPSYIPSRTFSLALLDVVAPTSEGASGTSLQTTITNANIENGTKDALLALARSAANDRDRFRVLVEDWFDAAMDRVSGWYKRKTQVVICVLSLGVAVGLNVNTIAIAERLVRDDAVRAAVVAQAGRSTAEPGDPLKAVAGNISEVEELGLPLGWNKQEGDSAKADLAGHPGRTIGGWLLTFLALSLGAPFWFDALGRVANLRNAGVRPKKAAELQS